MAAALVPLIAGLAPTVINLITALVHKQAPVAEVTHGPGTGPVKFADVFGAVMTALQKAAAAGSISSTLPSDDIVKVVIQAVVSSMQLMGALGSSAVIPDTTAAVLAVTPTPSGQPTISLKAGQTLLVTVQ